jgi:hypothetical protein
MVFPEQRVRSHAIGMKNAKRNMIGPSAISRVQLGLPIHTSKLFGEWQQRGPETFLGNVVGKLRLTLAPPQSVATANVRG